MEYGLWNLPTGFWQAGTQGNVPVDPMGRPYYNPANGIPPAVFHNNINEGDINQYAVTNSQSYRHQTEYLAAAKNGLTARHNPQDDKNAVQGLLPMTDETLEHRGLDNFNSESASQQADSTLPEDSKEHLKLKCPSPVFQESIENNCQPKSNPTIDYLKQQSFQHPMYGMIFSQIATTNKVEATNSDAEEIEEEPITAPSVVAPPVFEEDSQSASCRSSGNGHSSRAGFECGECGLVAETRPSLKKHIANAHPDTQLGDGSMDKMSSVPNTCPMAPCRFRTSEKDEMEAHIARHVSEGYNTNGKKKACPIALQRVRYEREEYRCQMCAYSCTIEKAFYKHLKVHTIGPQSSSPIKISCVICGKDRTSEVDMNKHMKKHRDDRHFCCDICIFKTVQLKKLIQHRRMHTGEKPHLCPHCSYRSARRDNLRSHVRRVHKKENLYCDTFSPRGLLVTPNVVPSPTSPVPASSQDTQDA